MEDFDLAQRQQQRHSQRVDELASDPRSFRGEEAAAEDAAAAVAAASATSQYVDEGVRESGGGPRPAPSSPLRAGRGALREFGASHSPAKANSLGPAAAAGRVQKRDAALMEDREATLMEEALPAYAPPPAAAAAAAAAATAAAEASATLAQFAAPPLQPAAGPSSATTAQPNVEFVSGVCGEHPDTRGAFDFMSKVFSGDNDVLVHRYVFGLAGTEWDDGRLPVSAQPPRTAQVHRGSPHCPREGGRPIVSARRALGPRPGRNR